MPKYYCDYCKSYLTHDTMSVRKSHLSGRNHIRYYCNYYELKAKETGIWDPSDSKYDVSLDKLNQSIPDPDKFAKQARKLKNMSRFNHTDGMEVDSNGDDDADSSDEFNIPPPPNSADLPNPPPSVLRYTEDFKSASSRYAIKSTSIV